MNPVLYITFPLALADRPLPRDVKHHAHPKGFAAVVAENRAKAQFIASFIYGKEGWSNVYEESEIKFENYPLGEIARFYEGQTPEPAPRAIVTDDGHVLIRGHARVWTPGEASALVESITEAANAAVAQQAENAADAARLSEAGVKRHDDMW